MGRDGVKCEGAAGSLAIVAPGRGPSHPCGLTPRIAIASDVPRSSRKCVRRLWAEPGETMTQGIHRLARRLCGSPTASLPWTFGATHGVRTGSGGDTRRVMLPNASGRRQTCSRTNRTRDGGPVRQRRPEDVAGARRDSRRIRRSPVGENMAGDRGRCSAARSAPLIEQWLAKRDGRSLRVIR
jgi:hypothetical protein